MGDEFSQKEVPEVEVIGGVSKKGRDWGLIGMGAAVLVPLGIFGSMVTFLILEIRGHVRAAEVAFNSPELTLADLVQYQGQYIDKEFAFADLHDCVMRLKPLYTDKEIFVKVPKEIWVLCHTGCSLDVVAIEEGLNRERKHQEAMERIRRGETAPETPPESAEKK